MPPGGSSWLRSGGGVGGLKELPVGRVVASVGKWTGWGLNPRPLPWQDSDLPADLPAQWGARKLAGLNRYPHRGDTKGVLDPCGQGFSTSARCSESPPFRPHGTEFTSGVIPGDYRWTRAWGMG